MSEEIKNFFSTYTDFVTKVTSDPSIDLDSLKNSFDDIESSSSINPYCNNNSVNCVSNLIIG